MTRHFYQLLIAILFTTFIPTALATDLDQVLTNAQGTHQAALNTKKQREQAFLDASDRQHELDQLKAQISALESEIALQEKEVHGYEDLLDGQQKALAAQLGDLGKVFSLSQQVASDTSKHLHDSLISAELPGRTEKIKAIVQDPLLSELDQVDQLWLTMLQEMKAQSEVKQISSVVISPDGSENKAELIRIGPFTAVQNGRYIEYIPEHNKFRMLASQPGGKFLDAANSLEQGNKPGVVAAAIDPSRGSILALLTQTPDLEERLHQGGIVGYIILALAAGGILLALIRIIMLLLTAFQVEKQKRQLNELSNDNPLGRVLLSVEDHDSNDTEMIERKLDESILKELPRLEWGLPLIKLLAAIAPLLGLLGTVVGMILTFQAISLFGSGDPKLMAGGISQALVTTLLGLTTAIPLLLLHSVANSARHRVEQTLEEQSAALVAERIEVRQ